MDLRYRFDQRCDRGRNWISGPIAQATDAIYFAYLIARGDRDLVATWFASRNQALMVHVALIAESAGASAPIVEW